MTRPMSGYQMTDQARRVLSLAEGEARELAHEYVGTEHILLGLVEEGSGLAADVLEAFGVTPKAVRDEVERLVMRGPAATAAHALPLTPRARRALEFADDEGRLVSQRSIDAEHLLLGLVREQDGVAGQVLRNLGMQLAAVREAVLKIRVLQMTIVERAVRPVRATVLWKRKRREELLAHLTAIYDEEQAELNNPAAAVQAAARRFGDPAELAVELDRSVSASERFGYYVERGFAWRAPESVLRYSWRLAVQTLTLLAITFCGVAAVVAAVVGWQRASWELLRVFAAILATAPPTVFVLAWSNIKLRDAMWGAFGSRRSAARVLGFVLVSGLAAAGFVASVTALAHGLLAKPAEMWPSLLVAAGVMPLVSLLAARLDGPAEIRDAVWALLDLSTSAGDRGDASVELA
jgi:ATP-dependent Clp protease ATP-binding subunit ClpC